MAARRAVASLDGAARPVSPRVRGECVAEVETPGAGVQVAEIQRARLLAAAVGTVDELGYSETTVSHITNRARVSRRTFYELFENREDCFAAMFERALELIRSEIAQAGLEGLSWRERVRGGLWTILCFLEREPALARVCVVQSLRGDRRMLDLRSDTLARLADVLDGGRAGSTRGSGLPALTAEGLVGAAHSIVYKRVLDEGPEPLTGLLSELMGMIVLPYLGPEAARREQDRPAPSASPSPASPVEVGVEGAQADRNPLEDIPMRITYRTALVLQHIAERPGISNREVADLAGVSDQGQMSKLLSRLQRLGLIDNAGMGHSKGEPNAWTLTHTGLQVARSILAHKPDDAVVP